MKLNTILQGDSLAVLKTLPSESVECVMTSPPYWALRDYGTEGQLGLEPTFQEYITRLCDIFDEVKRVLKKSGTCWVNIGDTYSGSGKGATSNPNPKTKEVYIPTNKPIIQNRITTEKSLCLIPFRFVLEMQKRGWILRNTIIWHKPNCMPSSAKDRFTVDFEYLFFFVKNKKYYFETQFEKLQEGSLEKSKLDLKLRNERLGNLHRKESYVNDMNRTGKGTGINSGRYIESIIDRMERFGRNKRAVWTITTQPFSEPHFAVFPEALCETPIKAGCPEFVCNKCGKPREKLYESVGSPRDRTKGKQYNIEHQSGISNISGSKWWKFREENPDKFLGLSDCGCKAGFSTGVFMDSFAGSGTSCLVAKKLGRNYLGIELNPEYIKLANERISGFQRSDWKAKKQHKPLEMIKKGVDEE